VGVLIVVGFIAGICRARRSLRDWDDSLTWLFDL
jgi:hypothetical protein